MIHWTQIDKKSCSSANTLFAGEHVVRWRTQRTTCSPANNTAKRRKCQKKCVKSIKILKYLYIIPY